ncbi:hypothetical protein HGRIS_014092 [Hohenbuehelia grisea]|uniref:DUF5648 domain-containing protein n=1 Tax=Hohenbuehelia grisea TaxID=104357 RepID=A0ABR3JTR4_9AGAR
MKYFAVFTAFALIAIGLAAAIPTDAAGNTLMAALPNREAPRYGNGRHGDDGDKLPVRRPGHYRPNHGGRGDDDDDDDDRRKHRPGRRPPYRGGHNDDDDQHRPGRRPPYRGGHNDDDDQDPCKEALENLVTVYELRAASNKDWMYTLNPTEIISLVGKGWSIPKAPGTFRVISKQVRGSVPIYRMYNPTLQDHTLATEEKQDALRAKGYLDDGKLGFMFKTAQCGTLPVTQLWIANDYIAHVYSAAQIYRQYFAVNNHLFKIDPAEVAYESHYTKEGTLAYAFPMTVQPKPKPHRKH